MKTIREIKKKNSKLLIKNQLAFYIAYLLVAMEILFLYKGMLQIFDKTTIVWTLLVIIVENINYSLLMHKKTANYLELIAYSIGLIIHVVMSVKANIEAVEFFD